MSDTLIPHADYHKNLGLILLEDLRHHYKFIISHAYKTLIGLIRRTFNSNQLPATLAKL